MIFEEVALRKESVDRNMYRMNCHLTDDLSLSARRAWIEISRHLVGVHFGLVALRKESVDRNRMALFLAPPTMCRSPQGERG